MDPESKPTTGSAETCQVCDKQATNKCGGCKSTKSATFYCTKDCQKQDWPSHKNVCKDRALECALEKATDIALVAYLKFRENTWDIPIVDVTAEEDALTIHRNFDSPQDYFVPFPHRVFNSGVKEDDVRNANQVLCTFVCEEALAWMHNTLVALLDGIVPPLISMSEASFLPAPGLKVRMDEVNVKLVNIPRKTVIAHPTGFTHSNWPGHSHDILRITSKITGTQWIMDLSGAQYGISAAFWSWNDYSAQYVQSIENVYPLGTHKQQKAIEAKIWGNTTLDCGVVGEVAAAMNAAVKVWEKKHKVKLADVIKLPDAQYLEMGKKLTDHMSKATQSYIKGLNITSKVRAIRMYELDPANRDFREAKRAKVVNEFLASSDTLKKKDKEEKARRYPEFNDPDFDPVKFFKDFDNNMGSTTMQILGRDGSVKTVTI
ncbi:hypothetical protein NX059_007161 [Plenodomus lindquistii]|nr:hypothetical protein NX059_007161 [Plenodomus lindquistii]